MITLFLLLLLGMVTFFIVLSLNRFKKDENSSLGVFALAMSLIIGIFSIIVFGYILGFVNSASRYNAVSGKIKMYEKENSNIEEQMDVLVKNYMEYEKETIKNCSPKSSITLVSLYPKLKSDALVSKQMDVYYKNNNKIKKLKEDKLDISTDRWLLYFGK